MRIVLFLFATFFLHLSLHYFVIPRLELNKKPLSRSVLLAISKYMSVTALLASLSYLLIILLIVVLSWSHLSLARLVLLRGTRI